MSTIWLHRFLWIIWFPVIFWMLSLGNDIGIIYTSHVDA